MILVSLGTYYNWSVAYVENGSLFSRTRRSVCCELFRWIETCFPQHIGTGNNLSRMSGQLQKEFFLCQVFPAYHNCSFQCKQRPWRQLSVRTLFCLFFTFYFRFFFTVTCNASLPSRYTLGTESNLAACYDEMKHVKHS